MYSLERHNFIINYVNKRSFSSLEELALLCDTSTQTIRRDITKLDKEKKLIRLHGGAASIKKDINFSHRRERNTSAKHQIATILANTIPEKATLFIAGGTTLEICAEHLKSHDSLYILTTNLHVALAFEESTNSTIILPHGEIQSQNNSLYGVSVVESINKYRMDFSLISCCAMDDTGNLYENNSAIAANIDAMRKNSTRTVLVVDSSKFSQFSNIKSAKIEDIDIFISDKKPPETIYKSLIKTKATILYPQMEEKDV